jgi:hypothetical protein
MSECLNKKSEPPRHQDTKKPQEGQKEKKESFANSGFLGASW